MSRSGPELRIGTSGYQYNHWRGLFYPQEMRQDRWCEHYMEFFDTVEMNNTFYHLPTAETFRRWRRRANSGFCYVLKYSRYGSHIMHLKNPHDHIQLFLENARELGPRLGPILVQLPPKWRVDVARLEEFLQAAPRKQRWAFEFRHPSWLCPEVYRVLKKHGAALCIHDKIPDHPVEITADWTYLRYHGGPADGNYHSSHLRAEARKIKLQLSSGLDVFAYFNNDLHGFALINAADLKHFVTGQPNRLRELQLFW